MSVILEVNNTPYTNFKSISVTRSMETLSSSFTAVATIDNFRSFPIKLGSKVRILIDGIPVLTGFIENLSPYYDNSIHEVTISGRDKTCDIIDSSLISPVNFPSKISLKDVILKILSGNNINSKIVSESEQERANNEGFIGIIDLVNPSEFGDGDIIATDVGENVFEVINKYCAKRQVLVTTDGRGNVLISRGSEKKINRSLVHRKRSAENNLLETPIRDTLLIPNTRQNNILSSRSEYSILSRFNKYIVRTQGNLNSLSDILQSIDPKSAVSQKGEAFDSEIRETRALVISADTSNTDETALERAKWEANIRRARAFNYECVVQGFFADDGVLWQPNYLANVEDDTQDVNGFLLIKSVVYDFSLDGSKTKLNLGYKDSFTLQAQQVLREANENKFGDNVLF